MRWYKSCTFVSLIGSSLFLNTACSDEGVFEKRAEEASVETEINKKLEDEESINELKVSEEQLDILEDDSLSKDAKEALENGNLETRKEVAPATISQKSSFTDVNEFSGYMNNLFFKYHSAQIGGETFFTAASPHFSKEFLNLLPGDEEQQIKTFNILQGAFLAQIKSPIVDYKITEVKIRERSQEANVYRKYIQANGEEIYYESVYVKKGDTWLLLDDSPAAPYTLGTDSRDFKDIKEGEKDNESKQ